MKEDTFDAAVRLTKARQYAAIASEALSNSRTYAHGEIDTRLHVQLDQAEDAIDEVTVSIETALSCLRAMRCKP